ncbi:hypothetical protein K461DRAFT_226052, partial [Myriangium duriaei CBS 260.36]
VETGHGYTIAAGSVVTRGIPPYSKVMSTLCRVHMTLPSVEEGMADPDNPYMAMVGQAWRDEYVGNFFQEAI